MTSLPIWSTAIHLIGWTLLHFLWQGTLLGLVYVLIRPVLARGLVRYRFGMGILFALALCPFLTLWRLVDAVPSMTVSDLGFLPPATVGQSMVGGVSGAVAGFDALLPWLVLAWLLGVLLHSTRAWCQWRALKMVVSVAEPIPHWQQRVTAMSQRFDLHRHVTIFGSRILTSPVLIGWMRPVILLPMAVLCDFPASQIELILAHELAHLRRWDPFVNLFQVVLETACFYHPVVRWISRDVNNEREICCDQLALSLGGGSRREFVTVLAELGDLRERQNSLLLAANGGALLDRVQMMMLPQKQVAQARKCAHIVAMVLCIGLVILTLRLRWVQAQMQDGMDLAIRQLQALVLPAALPLVAPAAAWHVPNIAAIPFAPLKLFASELKTAPTTAVSPMRPVALPGQTLIPVLDLKPDQLDVPALSAAEIVPLQPASAATPTPIHVRQPVYPRLAQDRGIEGQVVIEFGLTKDGGVHDPRMVSSTPAGVFDQAALDAMRFWKYATPAVGASARYRQTISFTLNTQRSARIGSKVLSTRDIQARSACQILTGTHICRWPDNASPGPVSR